MLSIAVAQVMVRWDGKTSGRFTRRLTANSGDFRGDSPVVARASAFEIHLRSRVRRCLAVREELPQFREPFHLNENRRADKRVRNPADIRVFSPVLPPDQHPAGRLYRDGARALTKGEHKTAPPDFSQHLPAGHKCSDRI